MEQMNYMERSRYKKEKLILAVYSLYTLAMSFVSVLLHWAEWVPAVVIGGMIFSWVIHIKKYKDYRFRAFAITCMALMDFVIYGAFSENFFGILSTLGALVILLGIFNIPEILYMAGGCSVFLLFYHGVVIQTIHITSLHEGTRMLLQIGSIFTIECVTCYLVKSHLEMNEELMETIETLKKAEQSKDDFVANVSHEIRTPINTVCGMSEMVLREEIPERVREYAFDIQTAGRNLLSVVSDILDFSELESGKMELVEEPYNLTSTVNDVMNIAVAQKNGKNIELIVDCDAQIPSSLSGDEQKIRRVIMNLVNNALKFTVEGCVTIEFSARREEYGINLSVKVKDTGIGMKEEDLEKLFTTFNQVDTKKNRQEGGIGLGLAISQAIVQKMGGFISVKSVFGKGSEIQLVIPQKVLEDTPIVSVKNPERIRVAGYINMEKYDFASVREGYAQSIAHMVEQLGIGYRQCRNLAELKRRVEKENYTHVFIGWEEYCEERSYFENLSQELKVILVLERENDSSVGGELLRIYKPFYVLSVASVLNGENIIQSIDGSQYQHGRFIAPKASILVVDDNMMNIKVVEGLLRPYKIKVFTAISGKEALKKIETMDYDFVFMDHMMPEMDGVETLHRIRQKPGNYFQTVPIIALTANAIGGVREMFLAEGFQDFVAKPIELSVLERVLRRFIPENKIMKVEEYETAAAVSEIPVSSKEQREKILEEAGIDINKGIAFCGGNIKDYLEVVEVYYETGLSKKSEIQNSYEAADWKNYTILVHAVKSTSLGIGAIELSEMAKKLEAAGKEERADYIHSHHNEMMQEYNRILGVIGAEQGETAEAPEKSEDVPEIDEQKLKEYLTELGDKLETFESVEVEQVLNELSKYQYHGKELKEQMEPIWAKVKEFDFMGASEMLEEVQEKMR